jgi:Glycosyl hydrolase catalytic core
MKRNLLQSGNLLKIEKISLITRNNFFKIQLCFFLILILLTTISAAPVKEYKFRWGLTGHPLSGQSYLDIGIPAQLDFLLELKVGWYRFALLQSVFEQRPEQIDLLVKEASKRNIKLLPILIADSLLEMKAEPPEKIHLLSKKFAKSVVKRYKHSFNEWQLDNELFSYALLRKGEKSMNGEIWRWGDPEGSKPEEYESIRFEQTKARIFGLFEGVKSADPEAVTIVGDGWLHYGYLERLLGIGTLPFDKLSWHWYSEMGDITNVSTNVGRKLNLIDYLQRYRKPILITEMNRRNGSMYNNERAQAEYIDRDVKLLSRNPKIEGLFIYELLDEPYLGINNGESYYGLIKVSNGSMNKWKIERKKKSFMSYKRLIEKSLVRQP